MFNCCICMYDICIYVCTDMCSMLIPDQYSTTILASKTAVTGAQLPQGLALAPGAPLLPPWRPLQRGQTHRGNQFCAETMDSAKA